MLSQLIVLIMLIAATTAGAREYHVSVSGDDANDGSAAKMLRTIGAAAQRAQPGDVIIVHQGVYRERVDPPRGGTSDDARIVYRAAPGEKVVIKGSEIVKGWERVENDTWKVVIPNEYFGDFNPYRDAISGDWFTPKGRLHHTGAVYLNGHWLTEAARFDEVLEPAGENPLWFTDDVGRGYLLNVAWIWAGKRDDIYTRTPAESFAAQHGVQTAPCTEGGQCVGWIEDGDWVRYDGVDFGESTESVAIRTASATSGGIIELRLDGPDGKIIGGCKVANTGGWQKWTTVYIDAGGLSGIQTVCLVFRAHESNRDNTTIWAQFPGVDPNAAGVEINVRQTVFYAKEPGRNYITVRGFTMEHAATPWAPPTAEQIGLIGTHWSKGWIIEDSTIRYSTCVGITLGKHGDEYDNTSQNTAEGYVKTIDRGLANGWSKENIGHHVVRNNRISHCEQAGIVGSLGPVFCTVTGNVIHDIHVRRLFTGAEMAGIKFHAAVDTLISGNHIYRTSRGIWLDWMTQGTRVTRNLLHDNGPSEDLYVEVNHGPFLVDHNILLSPTSLLDMSEGGAYAHNLMTGRVVLYPEPRRLTPFLEEHGTKVSGLAPTRGGDNRFVNNVFAGESGLAAYDEADLPVMMCGNVFLAGAASCKHELDPVVDTDSNPGIKLTHISGASFLELRLDPVWKEPRTRHLVTTSLLGNAQIPDLPYVKPDGSPYRLDTDYTGNVRNTESPFPGPFRLPKGGKHRIKVWPVAGM